MENTVTAASSQTATFTTPQVADDSRIPPSIDTMLKYPTITYDQLDIVLSRVVGRVKTLIEVVVPNGAQCEATKKQVAQCVWLEADTIRHYAMEFYEAAHSESPETWRPPFPIE